MLVKQATARLKEWENFSYPLAYIAKCLQQVMTEEIAGWVMQEGKSAQGLWDYMNAQVSKNIKSEKSNQPINMFVSPSEKSNQPVSVLLSPPEMQELIYNYLKRDEKAAAKAKEKKAVATVKPVLKQEVEPASEPVLNEEVEPASEVKQDSFFDEEAEPEADEQLVLI